MAAILGCGHHYYTGNNKDLEGGEIYCLPIDNSFNWYVRRVYKDISSIIPSLAANLSYVKHRHSPVLIEVEYLLVSAAQKKVVYITCESDKYEHYYNDCWGGPSLINIYDIKNFSAGTLNGTKATFMGLPSEKKHLKDTWDFVFSPGKLEITIVNEFNNKKNPALKPETYQINNSILIPMEFLSAASGQFTFSTNGYGVLPDAKSVDNTIYFFKHNGDYQLYFAMDRSVGTNIQTGGNTDKIFFHKEKIIYDPSPVITQKAAKP